MDYTIDDFITYYKLVLDKRISRISDFEEQIDTSSQDIIFEKLSPYVKNKRDLLDLFPDILNFRFSPTSNNYKISWISGFKVGENIKEDLSKLKFGEDFYIVSPYIGDNDFSDLSRIIMDLIKRGVRVKILTTSEMQENKKNFLKKFIKFSKNKDGYFLTFINEQMVKFQDKKINFYILDGINLHSKIYIINNTIYIGSSNFTGDGFYSKLETVHRAEFIGKSLDENVKTNFIKQIEKYKKIYNTLYTSDREDCQKIGKKIYE